MSSNDDNLISHTPRTFTPQAAMDYVRTKSMDVTDKPIRFVRKETGKPVYVGETTIIWTD